MEEEQKYHCKSCKKVLTTSILVKPPSEAFSDHLVCPYCGWMYGFGLSAYCVKVDWVSLVVRI